MKKKMLVATMLALSIAAVGCSRTEDSASIRLLTQGSFAAGGS